MFKVNNKDNNQSDVGQFIMQKGGRSGTLLFSLHRKSMRPKLRFLIGSCIAFILLVSSGENVCIENYKLNYSELNYTHKPSNANEHLVTQIVQNNLGSFQNILQN